MGNRIVVNLIPALQFVSQHLDALVKAGIIVASVFAGRMTASLVATTVAFIAGQAEAMRYQMALARMADVSALTATRLNALAMTSRLLTASGGFIGLGVAVASTIAGFLLMKKSSDDVVISLDDQKKSVAELKTEYSQLSEIQKRVKYGEQLDKINELTKAYHKQSHALEDVILDSKGFYRASIEQQDQIYALVQAYKNGTLSAEQFANELNKLGFVSDELKRRIDKQATATTLAKNELDNANDVLSAYQGKTISATSATNGLSSGLDNVGRSAEKTTAKIGELSKQYKDLMEQTKKDIFELEMTNALIQKHGFEPERASAIAKARSAKGSDLTKDDIALIDRHLSAQNKYAELTKKDEPSTTSAKKSTAPRVVGIVGDTGIGATHLDIRRADGKKPTQSDLDRFRAGGKKLTDYRMTSGYGHRNINVEGASKFHKGLDFAIAKGTEVTTTVPVKDVKKWYDKKGGWVSKVMFEDGLVMKLLHQDPSMQKKVMGGSSGSSSSGTSKVKNEKKYNHTKDEIIALKRVQGLIYGNSGLADLARKHGVPAELLAGLMMQESKGLQYAKSPTGALGYFQTTSSYRTDMKMSKEDSFDLKKSGVKAIEFLAKSYEQFGNWEDAIRSYNAGRGGASQFARTGRVKGSEARNREVREYVPKIAKWSAWFGGDEALDHEHDARQNLAYIQAQNDIIKEQERKAKEEAEKRSELEYYYASEPIKLKTDYEKQVADIKSAGFEIAQETELLQKAEQEYQDKLTHRPEILERALGAVKQLEQDFLGVTVSEHEKTMHDIEHKYDDLLADINALKELAIDPVHLAELTDAERKIRLIIDKEKLKAEYDNAMAELDKMQASKQQQLDILQQRYDNTNMTAHEFHTQKQAIDTEINPQLQTMATYAQLLAQSLGDAFSVEKLGLFIDGLNQAQSSFQQFLPTAEQLNDRITNGLADAFFTFADGTKSAEQAFREFASAFFREIAQMILKQMIFNAISTAGKAGGGGWGGMVAGVLGSAFGGKGYATGGYAGKGGKYEPAGIVHRDEFVIRKEMTNQVGAKEFLAQFNRYGMNAIKDLQGYSSGGLVGASMPQIFAPNIQAPKLSSPSEKIAQSTSLNNQQNFYLVDDPSRILDTLSSSQGQENLVVMMSRDPEKFKTALRL